MKISMNNQTFGMALERPFPDNVNQYTSEGRTHSTDKYLSKTIEDVANAQKSNNKYNIITAIEYNTFVAKVIRNSDKKTVRTFKQSNIGNAADTLKSASVNATFRNGLYKLCHFKALK